MMNSQDKKTCFTMRALWVSTTQTHGFFGQRPAISFVCAIWLLAGTLGAEAIKAADNKSAFMKNKLEVFVKGDETYVRSPFSKEQDLVRVIGKGPNNRQVNFSWTGLIPAGASFDDKTVAGATRIHNCGDDSTPWNINSMYIGANHGCSSSREITCTGHGLSTADLGSEWTDGARVKWYVMKIVDNDKLWLLSQNNGTGDIWKFTSTLTGTILKRSSNGKTLQVQNNVMTQLYPAVRILRQQCLKDGKMLLPARGVTKCDFIDFVEENEIVNPGAVLADVIGNPGKKRDFVAAPLPATIANTITYRIHPDGSTVITYKAKVLQDLNIGYMGFIQSAPLSRGSYTSHRYYIPKAIPFVKNSVNYDFRATQDFSKPVPVPLNFSESDGDIENPDNLPDRFIQLLGQGDGKTARSKTGYALGYSLVQGMTVPAKRKKHTKRALFIHTSNKSYPSALDAQFAPMIKAGTEFFCVAYRRYFNPEGLKNATCAYWYNDGNNIVTYIDYHKSVARDIVMLPPECAGKNITVVERTPSLTLHTDKSVPASGVSISVKGDYGYIVISTPYNSK
ncbi:MAG: hypothetical protein PHR77_13340 [Kiritimatiellae bacterium]|nr:hypothetical protein [Kiritimatiellia bacterium]MDD5523217.1 hypothetical protein [Kiritimatiellia bacterium]